MEGLVLKVVVGGVFFEDIFLRVGEEGEWELAVFVVGVGFFEFFEGVGGDGEDGEVGFLETRCVGRRWR